MCSHRFELSFVTARFGSSGSPKKITHFHGSGAFWSDAAMSTEQTHQRLRVAEGVIRELQDQLQRVSAGHQSTHEALQTIHQEMSLLRSQIDTRSRTRLVEPKSLKPDRFGKEERPELENLVVLGKGLRWSGAFSTETGNEE